MSVLVIDWASSLESPIWGHWSFGEVFPQLYPWITYCGRNMQLNFYLINIYNKSISSFILFTSMWLDLYTGPPRGQAGGESCPGPTRRKPLNIDFHSVSMFCHMGPKKPWASYSGAPRFWKCGIFESVTLMGPQVNILPWAPQVNISPGPKNPLGDPAYTKIFIGLLFLQILFNNIHLGWFKYKIMFNKTRSVTLTGIDNKYYISYMPIKQLSYISSILDSFVFVNRYVFVVKEFKHEVYAPVVIMWEAW